MFVAISIIRVNLVEAACPGGTVNGTGGAGGSGGATLTTGSLGTAGCNGSATSGGGGGGGGGGSAAGGTGGCGAGGGILIKASSTITISGTIDNRGCGTSTTNGGTVKIFYTGTAPSTSTVSTGRLLVQSPPAAPTLSIPANSAINIAQLSNFQLKTTDSDNDYLRYKIQICSDNLCNSVLQTIDQTSSQTGWTGQDQQTSTAYTGNATLASSTMASFTLQAGNGLNPGTTYYWRGYAIDPGGTNTWSSASSIWSFTTIPPPVKIMGGVNIRGGTSIQ